jgi:epoxyqueuosine reductase
MSAPIVDNSPAALTAALRRRAREAGFDEVGVASATPPGRDVARLDAWLEAGRHASMHWMVAHRDARADPARLLPGCRHVVLVTLDHGGSDAAPTPPGAGAVARYARGRDYHRVFGKPLRRLARWLETASGAPARSFVDTGPVLERAFAERAGLGWIGKNACLIAPDRGSYLLIGEILTAARLVDDPVGAIDRCGSCVACLEACPTAAIVAPGEVDARRCVSYWTIEHRGPIPASMRPGLGSWMFGCDDCQTVCPWNRTFGRSPRADGAFEPREDLQALDPVEVLELDAEGFRKRFEGTPLMRARYDGLRRNACVVLGNLADRGSVPVLSRVLTGDADPTVRAHAAWALGRIGGPEARRVLGDAANGEREPVVGDEIRAAIGVLSNS